MGIWGSAASGLNAQLWESNRSEFSSQLYQLGNTAQVYLTSPSFHFLLCKVEKITVKERI